MSNFWENLQKPLILPVLLKNKRWDKRRLSKFAKAADAVQIILPDSGALAVEQAYARAEWPDFTLAEALEVIKKFRRKNHKPLLLTASVNQILNYGLRLFFTDFAEAGVNAFALRDLPLEESEEFVYLADQNQITLFLQASDTAAEERLTALLRTSPQGLLVVTAKKEQENQEIENLLNTVRRLKQKDGIPLIIDHGLYQEDNLCRAYQAADGLLLKSLLDMPDREALRRARKIRKILKKDSR